MPTSIFSLSIAGLDPTGGAGLLSDAKTFEALGSPGFGVATALTYQNEHTFDGLRWSQYDEIILQLESLFHAYEIGFVKIGLIENLKTLEKVTTYLKEKNNEIIIVWDPILSSSSGFQFHDADFLNSNKALFEEIDLLTPNQEEMEKLFTGGNISDIALDLSSSCSVLLKGGHNLAEHSNDHLFENGIKKVISGERLPYDKHGTGCVLSAAIVAYLSKGNSMEESCRRAKNYVTKFISSNTSLLGSHKLQHA